MFEAAAEALSQMLSPPFWAVLWKSIGLTLLLMVAAGLGLHRLLVWLAGLAEIRAEDFFGVTFHLPLEVIAWIISFAAGLGLVAGSVFLMPAATALVASFFVDDIALEVERSRYPGDLPGQPLPLARAVLEGGKTALLAILIYLLAAPFLLFAGFGALIFFFATAYILGREYFELAAMRFRPVAEAKRLRAAHQGTVFLAGMVIAAFVSIPIINLATPLFGMSFMVHMHKRIAGRSTTPLSR